MFKGKITETKKEALRKAIHSVANLYYNPKGKGFWEYWAVVLILGLISYVIFDISIIASYASIIVGHIIALIIAIILQYWMQLDEDEE